MSTASVTAYSPASHNGPALWHVVYEADSDEEDLEEHELVAATEVYERAYSQIWTCCQYILRGNSRATSCAEHVSCAVSADCVQWGRWWRGFQRACTTTTQPFLQSPTRTVCPQSALWLSWCTGGNERLEEDVTRAAAAAYATTARVGDTFSKFQVGGADTCRHLQGGHRNHHEHLP